MTNVECFSKQNPLKATKKQTGRQKANNTKQQETGRNRLKEVETADQACLEKHQTVSHMTTLRLKKADVSRFTN